MGTGFLKRKKEARALQEKLSSMRTQMETQEVKGLSPGNLVEITLKGDHSMKNIQIKPECVDKEDIQGLQDLIKAAYHDALKKMESQSMQGMQGLNLPNF